jgi:hypothetical protein
MKAESGEGTEAGRAAAVERTGWVQQALPVTTSWPDQGKGVGDRLKKKQAGAMMAVVGARMVERKVKKEKKRRRKS